VTALAHPAPTPSSSLTRTPGRRATRDARALDLLRQAQTASADERRQLHDDVAALYLEVAHSIALRYRGRGIALDDLVQAANEGLVKAISRFDPDLRFDFLSFAVPTMRGEVRRYFRDQGWTVRPPRRVQDLQWRRTRVLDGLRQQLGREPSRVELAEHLEVDVSEIDEADQAVGAFSPTSLDLPARDEEGSAALGDLLQDEDTSTLAAEARTMLQPVVRSLSERDRRVLFLRFFEDWTQKEIGEEIGVSQMQVSRTLTRLLGTLREQLDPDAEGLVGHPA
jgi:RNA polymerase sigma-B factor